jgi:hypothetical protein
MTWFAAARQFGWSDRMGVAGQGSEVGYQEIGSTRDFDAAGFPGRTVGLAP